MKTSHKAVGMIRHHFWGQYVAEIILGFESAESAKLAIEKLKLENTASYRDACGNARISNWFIHSKDPRAILLTVSEKAWEEMEIRLISFGADKKKMNSMAKSIDHGEKFEIEISA